MRRTKASIEKTTTEIIATALDVFSKMGYSATNLQHIADALGITRTPLYYHFKNKLQLYEQVVEHYLRLKEQEFIATFYSPNDDIFEKTRKHLTRYSLSSVMEDVLFMGIDSPELEYVRKIRRKSSEFIYNSKIAIVEEALRNKELKPETNTVEFVDHIYLLYFGFMRMNVPGTFDFIKRQDDETRAPLVDTIIQGMMLKYKP